jgi:penicillin-binding protein 1A
MNRVARFTLELGSWLFSLTCALAILAGLAGFLLFNYYNNDLPDYRQLADYDPPTVTRLYAADGRLLAEYASEKRVFVPLSAIPKRVRQAFISAEDKNFYEHRGIDFTGIARAIRDNIVHYGKGKSLVGGSTITQQVVKNFLLSSEKSIERKIKEAILATRISRVYSKDKILELYLNEIYLGLGSYGVAAAAQNYFNKSLNELTTEEIALLAAQPKAPASYDPRKNYEMAKNRRNWVIDRMREGGYVGDEEAETAKAAPITLKSRDLSEVAHAEFFAEEVRRWLAQMYGASALYSGGLVVKTTLDPELQKLSDRALRWALIEYDRRHGYRGPVTTLSRGDKIKERLSKLNKEQAYHLLEGQKLAVVTAVDDRKAHIAFDDDGPGIVPFSLMKWTKPGIRKPGDVLKTGHVIIVGPVPPEQKKTLTASEQKNAWDLQQIPAVNGAMMVLDPHTGRVLALSGGYNYGGSEFDRATQAKRQPGSAFKPFVYLAGLENGFTPSTVILDGPVEMEQGPGLPLWQPQNYEGEYIGAATMRVGLEKSRNTMTIRMAETVGIDKVIAVAKRFGIYDNLPPQFSIVLGAAETTLVRLVNAYGILANGGKRISPAIIERVDDRHGRTIYRRDGRECKNCTFLLETTSADAAGGKDSPALTQYAAANTPPLPEDDREQVVDPRVNYQIVSMLEGVTTRGTGVRAREIGKIVAGKTGTTNDSIDAWFVGFSPDLVAGIYIGYDQPRTLGAKETGSSVALPAFVAFMKAALADRPNKPFKIPRGIQLVPVDLTTGSPVTSEQPATGPVIQEAFVSGPPIFIPGVTPLPEQAASGNTITEENGELASPTPFAIPDTPQIMPEPPVHGTGGLY